MAETDTADVTPSDDASGALLRPTQQLNTELRL